MANFAKTIERKRLIISDKARFFDGDEMYRAVEQSIENLGEIPDIYFVHQVDLDNADEVFGKFGALDALVELKKEGKIRFTGIASHYYDVLLRGAKDSRVDYIDGELAGGLYGVVLGKCFFGESMFSEKENGSKVALILLAKLLLGEQFVMIDCQFHTEHLESMGGLTISWEEYKELLVMGNL